MKLTYTFNRLNVVLLLLFLGISNLLYSQSCTSYPSFSTRLPGGNVKIKGDLTLIGNNIVSVQTGGSFNNAFSGTGQNNGKAMGYIDIDGDASTFSSSSAKLTLSNPGCAKIKYAYLYWTAIYPYETTAPGGDNVIGLNETAATAGSTRQPDWNQVKFKMPGSATYIGLTADQVIWDGYKKATDGANYANGNTGGCKDTPYVCVKDVTSQMAGLATLNGDYTVANVRAAVGTRSSGESAGWALVVIYEDPAIPSKYISIFDGYQPMSNPALQQVDINVSGFKTIPTGPVNVKVGVAALEGDLGNTGDSFSIKSNSKATFTTISDAINVANDFFNSTVSIGGVSNPNRVPNNGNTLGFDLDLVTLANPSNGVIANGDTAATLRLTTNGDGYGVFLTTFAVDIIEPKINLTKRVFDIAGNDITGQPVVLGQTLDYKLSFQNVGNDDATSFKIRDILPINTSYTSVNVSGAPGVTYVVNAATGQIDFTIPDVLVKNGGAVYEIKIRVKVASSCEDLKDACSNIIQNQAYSNYKGVVNSNQITDDPSILGADSCGFVSPGSSNFLADLGSCIFARTEVLCNGSLLLKAANGYDTYVWTNSSNVVVGNSQNITVTSPGVYKVVTTSATCAGKTETITVTPYASGTANPIILYADQVATCPNDGVQLPKIFLCGSADARSLKINLSAVTSITWKKLNEASCSPIGIPDCANTDTLCSWMTVGTGTDYIANTEGQYKVEIVYQNGCFERFYFNVFKNVLNPQYTSKDILCSTNGSIAVTNVPSGYEFQLVNQATNTISVPYQTNPVFPITVAGAYQVQIRQQGVTGGCVFTIPDIGIVNKVLQINTIIANKTCNGLGSIRIQASNGNPQYYYSISGTTSITSGPSMTNDYTFNSLNPGNYTVTVKTDDGCLLTQNVVVGDDSNLKLTASVSQNIGCKDGNIQMNASGGKVPYSYTIYSYNGVVQPINSGTYQTSVIFDVPIGKQGTYIFQVVDSNNCIALSNPVTIDLVPDVVYTTSSQNVNCFGGSDGVIKYTVTNKNGYGVSFKLLDTLGNVLSTNTSGVFGNLPAGNYTVVLVETKGGSSCEFPQNFSISQPIAALTGSAEMVQPYTCTTTGTIRITPGSIAGGTAPYTYSVNGTTFVSSSVFTGLTGGTYSITIKDVNGCNLVTNSINLPALNPPTDLSFTKTPITCPTLKTNVTAVVTGGVAPIMYEIISPVGSAVNNGTNNVFSGLNAGTYTFKVTDSKNCTYQENFTINPITPINVTGTLTSNVKCLGDANGAVTYTVTGFSGTYDYQINGGSWVTGQTAASLVKNGLAAGIYAITVKDPVTNCTASTSITVAAPSTVLAVSKTVSPITCISQGSVTVTATGGWGSYAYKIIQPDSSVLGPQAGGIFSGLSQAGTYTVQVSDANGCSVTDTFNLTVPAPLTAAIDPTSDLCSDTSDNASLTINANGGISPYAYSLDNGSVSGPYQSSNVFTNLSPGSYTITVKDFYGCTTTVSQVLASQLLSSTILLKDLDCSATPQAQISVTLSGGMLTTSSYQVSSDGGVTFGSAVNFSGNNFIYETLLTGSYQLLITDGAGCSIKTNILEVTPKNPPVITSLVQTQNILCHGDSTGMIQVNVNPITGTSPFTTLVNTDTGTSFGSQTSGLPAGNYEVTVTDARSCVSNMMTISLTEPDAVSFSTTKIDIQCSGSVQTMGEITIATVTGGSGTYTYSIKDNLGITQTYAPTTNEDHTFTGLNFGTYEVQVIDLNKCFYKTTVTIASPPNDLDIDVSTVTTNCLLGGTAVVKAISATSTNTFEFAVLETTVPPYASSYFSPDAGFPRQKTFTGLTPGVLYTFVVHDLTTGCYYFEESTAPINTPSTLTINPPVPNNVTCTGSANGSVSFTLQNNYAVPTDVSYQIYASPTLVPVGSPVNVTLPASASINVSAFGVLAPGKYYVLVKEDAAATNAGCSVASSVFTITESPVLLTVSALVVKNANCNPNSGIISIKAANGTAPYQYKLLLDTDPVPSAGTAGWVSTNIFNVNSAKYVAYVKDAYNCIQSFSFPGVLPMDPVPVVSASVANQCSAQEGNFTLNVVRTSPGIAPYTYSLDGGAFQSKTPASFIYTGLFSGPHTVRIKDANGCISSTGAVSILPTLGGASTVSALPTCANNDGSVTVTAIGGSGNYNYELQNTSGTVITPSQPSNIFNGLAAGNYKVIVKDMTTGCTANNLVSLTAPTPVTISTTHQDITCNGGNDGVISITLPATNDNPPYTYSVKLGASPAIIQNNGLFAGLTAGTYTVTVTSGRSCTTTQSVTILQRSILTLPASATPFVCNLNNQAQVSILTATASGGTAPYSYSIDGVNYFTSNAFTVMDTGVPQTKTVTVKDNFGCLKTTTVTVNPLVYVTATSITKLLPITCANDEQVRINVTGGTGPFSYQLLPSGTPQPSSDFNLNAPGTYVFRVTDTATDCYVDTTPHTIIPFNTITASVMTSKSVTCYGAADGEVSLNITGYTGAYSYKVLDDANAVIKSGTGNTSTNPMIIAGLPSGNVKIDITETVAPFCVVSSNVTTIDSPIAPLSLTASKTADATCANNQGEIAAYATGGWGGYQFELVNTTTSVILQPFGINNVFIGLAAGNYTVNLKDSKGCTLSQPLTLTPATITSAVAAASTGTLLCHGDTNANITVSSVTGGSGSYQYSLNYYDVTGTTIVFTSGAQMSNTFTGLGAGTYSVTISDGWNCDSTTAKVTITEPTPVTGYLNQTSSLTCAPSSAVLTLSAAGGVSPYQYSTDNSSYNSTVVYNVGPGVYQYYVKDFNGCQAVLTNEITINPVPTLKVNLDLTAAIISCNGGATAVIYATAEGALGNYQYTLQDASNNPILSQSSGTFSNLPAGTYYVAVQSGDCNAISTVITIVDPPLLQIVNPIIKTDVSCNGGNDGTITIKTTGGTGIVQFAISPNMDQFFSTDTFTNLTPGTYDVLVQDQAGCFIMVSVTINEPTAVSMVTTPNHQICADDPKGSVTIGINGGAGPYKADLYAVDNSQGTSALVTNASGIANTHTFSGLNPGDYYIEAYDSKGCPIFDFTTLNEPVDLSISNIDVVYNCTANVPGNSVTVMVNAASVGNVQYSIDGSTYQTGNVFTNLAAGTYTIYVKHNGNGCTKTQDVTIAPKTPVTASIGSIVDATCSGSATGSITVTASGGTTPLQYAISPGYVYQSGNVFNNLIAGTYDIKVRDAIGCEVLLSNNTVTQPAVISVSLNNAAQELCFGDNNGSITVNVTGGTAPYATSLDNITYVSGQTTFSNLKGGQTYTVYVKDTNNCVPSVQFTKALNPSVDLQLSLTSSDQCTGNVPSHTIKATVNPSLVSSDVSYSLDGVTYQPGNLFSGLTSGTYTVWAKHVNGCVKSQTITINPKSSITASIGSVTDVTCNGSATGSITVTATGGTTPLQYAVSPGYVYQTGNVFSNLKAGTYDVKVKDAIGCEVLLLGNIINEPTAIAVSLTNVTQEICSGDNDGSITVSISGGTAPYATSLDGVTFVPGQTTTFSNLKGGQTYTVYVKDGNNCMPYPQFTYALKPSVDLQLSVTSSNQCTGNVPSHTIKATVNPTLVSTDLSYSLDGTNYQAGNVFAGLTAGTYTVWAKHSNGCVKQQNITINPKNPITISNVSVVPVTCNGSATGSITVTSGSGTTPLRFAISPGYVTQSGGVFSNLKAGTYDVKVSDAIGCEVILTNKAITEPSAVVVNSTAQIESCVGDKSGSIVLNISGGNAPYATSLNNVNYVTGDYTFENLKGGKEYAIYVKDMNNCYSQVNVPLSDPFDVKASVDLQYDCVKYTAIVNVDASVVNDIEYSLDGGAYQTGNVFDNMLSGSHQVTVKHKNNKCPDGVTVNVDVVEPLSLTLSQTNINELTATVQGGSGVYKYTLNDDYMGIQNVYNIHSTGTYDVEVTDANGCTDKKSIVLEYVDVDFPDNFTPNGDGYHDTWAPENTSSYPDLLVGIFDRYGRKIAALRVNESWDGRYNGTPLPTGDYWYVVKLGHVDDNREFVGHFTLYR